MKSEIPSGPSIPTATKAWHETSPPHLVVVGEAAAEYLLAERDRLVETGKPVLALTPETAGRLQERWFASERRAEPLFVVVCETMAKTVPVICERIAKRGRAMNVHLLAAFSEFADVPVALQGNAKVMHVNV